jgi:hypothetical protein
MDLYIAEKVSDMGADGFRIVRMAWFGPWDPKKFFEMQKRNPQIKEVRTVRRIDRRVPYNKPDNFALSTAEQMVADFWCR